MSGGVSNVDAGGGGSLAGVSVAGMDRLISGMDDAVLVLGPGLDYVRVRMRSRGFSFAAMGGIDRVVDWVEASLPELRRRRDLAAALAGDSPDDFVGQPDYLEFASSEEAQQHGRELATSLRQIDSSRNSDAELLEFIVELERYMRDPDVMAAFFAELGAEEIWRFRSMHGEITAAFTRFGGGDDPSDDYNIDRLRERFNRALGQGLSIALFHAENGPGLSEREEIRREFLDIPAGANLENELLLRMELLRYGNFPSSYVSQYVQQNIFDPDQDGQLDLGTRSVPPADAVFDLLAQYPAAARDVFSHPQGPSLDEFISYYLVDPIPSAEAGLGGVRPEVQEGFARALAAGAGVLEEPPDSSPEAVRFAFDVFQAFGRNEPLHPAVLQAVAEPLDRIAAAYAEELLLGAQSGSWPASMEQPDGFEMPFDGMEPAFFLDQQTVYSFLYWISAEPGQAPNFDDAIARITATLPDVIAADMAAIESGDMDISVNSLAAFEMLGMIHGMRFTATEHLWRQLDEEEAERRTQQSLNLTYGLIAVGFLSGVLLSPATGYRVGWGLAAVYILLTRPSLDYVEGGAQLPDLERPEWLNETTQQIVMVNCLLEAGYPHIGEIPPSLADPSGRYLDLGRIVENDLQDEFERWLEENEPVADQIRLLKDAFEAELGERADQVARQTGWGSPASGTFNTD